MDELLSVYNQRRGHAGALGVLTATMGIAAALTSGIAAPAALADTDGSSPSSGRAVTSRSAESSTDPGSQGDVPRSRGRTGPLSPAAAASRRALPKPAAGRGRPPANDIPKVPAAAVNPAEPDISIAPAAAASPESPRIESAETQPAPLASQTSSPTAFPIPQQPALAAAATPKVQPAAAARLVSPPIATVSLAASLTNLLNALSSALKGGTPSVPADAALGVMAAAARREIVAALSLAKAADKTATAASSTTSTAVEAEKMVVSGAVRVVSDRNASSRSALAFAGSGTASTTMSVPASTTALTIRARSTAGSPNMTVSMDGQPITTVVVGSTSYTDYTFAGTIAAGNHVISVSSSNATSTNQLYLDTVSTTVGAIGDQFTGKSGSAPSSTMWTSALGTGWDSGVQNYISGGSYLDGQGHLVIQATRGSNGTWTSGRVQTANKLSLGYGTVTARIKVPQGQGLWPAFWLIGADEATNKWPQVGEIDVMELPSTTTTLYSTLHGPIAGTTATQQAQIISTLPDLSTDYHNYWVRHLQNEITFGVDGQTLGTLTPADLAPGETWVYNRPMSVILNLAVGGSWAGAPDSTTPSTAKMIVESVTFTPA